VTESDTPTNDNTGNPEMTPEQPEAAPVSADAPVLDIGAQAASAEAAAAPQAPTSGLFWGTGRRKASVARVRLIPGEGKILINKREADKYFTQPQERIAVRESLAVANAEGQFNVFVNVRGGGHTGQAGAIRLGVARALIKADQRYEPLLRAKGYLTRDARVVERKKYGRRKARRRFQFSKR